MKNYGTSLKEHRVSRGLTLSQLEDAIGINNSSISRWENGKIIPSIDCCVKLADFYGITVDELIGRETR